MISVVFMLRTRSILLSEFSTGTVLFSAEYTVANVRWYCITTISNPECQHVAVESRSEVLSRMHVLQRADYKCKNSILPYKNRTSITLIFISTALFCTDLTALESQKARTDQSNFLCPLTLARQTTSCHAVTQYIRNQGAGQSPLLTDSLIFQQESIPLPLCTPTLSVSLHQFILDRTQP